MQKNISQNQVKNQIYGLDIHSMRRFQLSAKYIFIVGLPRTGTKLMRNILQGSPMIHCRISDEGFFLGHSISPVISPGVRHHINKIGDMSEDSNVVKLVDYMYSGKFVGTYWTMLKNGRLGVDKNQFLQEILKSDRTDKSIYEIIMRIHTNLTDTTILGDRTPSHLYHVPMLMKWFPEAKVIHTFRDPRAIIASQLKRLDLHYSMVVPYITISWIRAVRLHYTYKGLYPNNYILSQFEDLVSDPELKIKEICDFLNIEFHSDMLSPRKDISSFYSKKGATGFDRDTLVRWKHYLSPGIKKWIFFWTKKYLEQFGYSN